MIQGWRVNICWGKTVKVYCWPCQLKLNCFRWFLWASTKKRAFAKSIAAYHVPGDVLICSSKNTTSSTAAAIGTYWVFNSQLSFSTICLLHWTDKRVKGRCDRNHDPPHLSSSWWWHWLLWFLQGYNTIFDSLFSLAQALLEVSI